MEISGVASPKLGGEILGEKILTLGEQWYFIWETASQSIK